MKRLFLTFMFPLASFAQEAPTAIIVEEDEFSETPELVDASIEEAVSDATTDIETAAEELVETASDSVEDLTEAAANSVEDLTETASESVKDLTGNTSDSALSVLEAVTEELPHSPTEEDTTEQADEDPESEMVATQEELPETPEESLPAEKKEPIVVKLEIPKQIDLAKGHKSGFRLLSPWAPKPMQQAPLGWRYTPVSHDKAYPLEVKLRSGKTLALSVTPYALVPEEAKDVIQAIEPGYQAERGYQQLYSVSARLDNTTQGLKVAADSLNESIQNLSALVDSLPK